MGEQCGRNGGSSALGAIVMVAIIGYGVIVGIQYLPQWIEARTVDSILNSIRSSQQVNPASSVQEIQSRIASQLNLNDMNEMKDNFAVSQQRGQFVIDVRYERELNLLFEQKVIHYERTVSLQ